MTSRRKSSLKHMLAALDEADRRRVEQAAAGTDRRGGVELMRLAAWRLLTGSRRAELRIKHKLEAMRRG